MDREKRKITFIANPISGGKDKKTIISRVLRCLGEDFVTEVVYTARPGHGTSLARESDADIVVAVGGDGTVSEVAAGISGTGKVLGIIPCGSGDGLALHLGISRNPEKAARVLRDGVAVTADGALVDGKPFFCTAGVGLDAIVAWKFAASGKRGLFNYIRQAWNTWKTWRGEDFEVETDGKSRRLKAVIITVGNANQWGNQARITPLASVRDGLLDVTIVLPFKTMEIPVLAFLLLTGRAHRSRRTICLKAAKVVIRRASAGPAHYDGDPCEKGAEIVLEPLPAALKVMVPRQRQNSI